MRSSVCIPITSIAIAHSPHSLCTLGTFFYKNNDRYEGEFQNDKKHGKGKYTYFDGKVVEGVWENDVQKK